jgi:hypothetical protein
MDRLVGRVYRVKEKGFFFVETPDGRSIYIHVKNILGKRIVVQVDDVFTFDLRDSTKNPGKIEGYNAIRISKAPSATSITSEAL